MLESSEKEEGQGVVVMNDQQDEAKEVEDEKLVHVVEKAKFPTPPGKRPGPTIGWNNNIIINTTFGNFNCLSFYR